LTNRTGNWPDRRIQGGILMTPRTTRLSRCSPCLWLFLLAGALSARSAFADPLYTITDLGTLPGQTSSVATGINNQGQVVGISYNNSDGHFGTSSSPPTAGPPRFWQSGSGAGSFLYSHGQMTQVSPVGGLAMSINDSGQVVGGQYSSINNLGQYVGGQNAGVQTDNPGTTSILVSGGATTILSPLFIPYSINTAGQVAGSVFVNAHGGDDSHPALYQNGQLTDLFPKVASGEYYDSRAVAINQKGNLLISVLPFYGPNGSQAGSISSYLYTASTGRTTNLTALPGGSGMVAAALNEKDEAVGGGFLYSKGTVQTLASLLPAPSAWSSLNATGINDRGQIIGQGAINGEEHAFLMTPHGQAVPEPGTLAIWALLASAAAVRTVARLM
jgi:probable HAF family extracellular repeat protein